MIAIPSMISNVTLNENNIEVFGEPIKYQETTEGVVLTYDNFETKLTTSEDIAGFNRIKNYLKEDSKTKAILALEVILLMAIATIVCIDFVMQHLEKLFKNIHDEENPLTSANADHFRKMGYFLLASIILNIVAAILVKLFFIKSYALHINLVEVLAILVLLSLAYIFEIGESSQQKKD